MAHRAAALPVARRRRAACAHRAGGRRKMLRVLGCGCRSQGSFAPGRQAAGGQPRLVAGHPGRARGVPQARFVSKADVQHWPLLGWLVAGGGTLLHRARAQARRAARGAPDGRGAAGRRHGGGVPRRHHRRRPGAAALPRQPAAGGHRHRHAGAAGGAALCRCRGHAVSPAAPCVGDTTLVQSLWCRRDGRQAWSRASWSCMPQAPRAMPTGARWPSTCASTEWPWPTRLQAGARRMNAADPAHPPRRHRHLARERGLPAPRLPGGARGRLPGAVQGRGAAPTARPSSRCSTWSTTRASSSPASWACREEAFAPPGRGRGPRRADRACRAAGLDRRAAPQDRRRAAVARRPARHHARHGARRATRRSSWRPSSWPPTSSSSTATRCCT